MMKDEPEGFEDAAVDLIANNYVWGMRARLTGDPRLAPRIEAGAARAVVRLVLTVLDQEREAILAKATEGRA